MALFDGRGLEGALREIGKDFVRQSIAAREAALRSPRDTRLSLPPGEARMPVNGYPAWVGTKDYSEVPPGLMAGSWNYPPWVAPPFDLPGPHEPKPEKGASKRRRKAIDAAFEVLPPDERPPEGT